MGAFGQSISGGICYSTKLFSSGKGQSQHTTPCDDANHGSAARTWLITGGVGALGVLTASWLHHQYSMASLVLSSRSGRSVLSENGLQELILAACCVTITR